MYTVNAYTQANVVQLAQSVPSLSTLVTALIAANLTGPLSKDTYKQSGGAIVTVLAPNNDAFAKLPPTYLKYLLQPENVRQLANVLELHVIPASYRAQSQTQTLSVKDLKGMDGQTLKTINGLELTVTVKGDDVFIGSALTKASKVIAGDNPAINGIVHIMDTVLLPATPPPVTAPPPTSGCTKTSCPFSFTNPSNANGGRCGEVDAASRMPDEIWSDSNAVDEYVATTIALYNVGGAKLVNSLCDRTGRTQNGSAVASWTSPDLMRLTCQDKCLCKYPCPDQPDQPFPLHLYCSLCGPKYNQPIEVKLWIKTSSGAMAAASSRTHSTGKEPKARRGLT